MVPMIEKNQFIEYENEWVAISPDNRVVAHGKNVKNVVKKLDELGDKDSVLTMVLPFDQHFAPLA